MTFELYIHITHKKQYIQRENDQHNHLKPGKEEKKEEEEEEEEGKRWGEREVVYHERLINGDYRREIPPSLLATSRIHKQSLAVPRLATSGDHFCIIFEFLFSLFTSPYTSLSG